MKSQSKQIANRSAMRLILGSIGVCLHQWIFVRTEERKSRVMDVLQCSWCGLRKGVRVW